LILSQGISGSLSANAEPERKVAQITTSAEALISRNKVPPSDGTSAKHGLQRCDRVVPCAANAFPNDPIGAAWIDPKLSSRLPSSREIKTVPSSQPYCNCHKGPSSLLVAVLRLEGRFGCGLVVSLVFRALPTSRQLLMFARPLV
jgi:hypothetical protein